MLARTIVRKLSSVACWLSSVKIHYSDKRINAVYIFSIKYSYSDILLEKKHLDFIYGILWIVVTVCFAAIELTIYCNGMVSVTSASRYLTSTSRYQSRPSMLIRGLIRKNSMELAEAVPIEILSSGYQVYKCNKQLYSFLLNPQLNCSRISFFLKIFLVSFDCLSKAANLFCER